METTIEQRMTDSIATTNPVVIVHGRRAGTCTVIDTSGDIISIMGVFAIRVPHAG